MLCKTAYYIFAEYKDDEVDDDSGGGGGGDDDDDDDDVSNAVKQLQGS